MGRPTFSMVINLKPSALTSFMNVHKKGEKAEQKSGLRKDKHSICHRLRYSIP